MILTCVNFLLAILTCKEAGANNYLRESRPELASDIPAFSKIIFSFFESILSKNISLTKGSGHLSVSGCVIKQKN